MRLHIVRRKVRGVFMSEPDLIERVLLVALSSAQYDVKEFGERLREESATMKDCRKMLAQAQAALAAYQKVKALPDELDKIVEKANEKLRLDPADTYAACTADDYGDCAERFRAALRGEGGSVK